ncbi:GDSL esterase/lipase 7-like [Malania oleifera]|uniref:GDSL esterase/lipase 7-like n=1 Tax=Malania oleifera TaxID=397392 RepID=UPI0025ADF19F|nr:GDSL esterase/lipase 7-like [Malania oleifera]
MGMPGPLKGSIPALYVFGDSLLDSGNNNYLNTKAKANFPPFGVDFIDHVATGRFTNGRTMADFIAQLTGLPFPPPLLSFSKGENITTGVNYASGSSGILHNTGKSEGTCLYFDKQIDLFQTTIEVGLKLLFKKPEELSSHLSKSLFLIDVGSNDLLGFLRNLGPAVLANPTVLFGFTQSLSNHLADRLQRLYNLGARKFLVVNIGPIGCTPGMLSMMGKSFSTTLQSECFEGFNAFLDMYNSKLPLLLKKLQSTLSGSVFVHVNANRMTLETLLKPTKFDMAPDSRHWRNPFRQMGTSHEDDPTSSSRLANPVGPDVAAPFVISRLAHRSCCRIYIREHTNDDRGSGARMRRTDM